MSLFSELLLYSIGRLTSTLCSKSKKIFQVLSQARFEPRTSRVGVFPEPLTIQPHSQFEFMKVLQIFKLHQKSINFEWPSRPRKVKKGHATSTGCSIRMWSIAQKQWLSKSRRIVRDTMLQARPGKNFHQKLYISDDSKIFLQTCRVDLLSTSSA